MTPSIEVMSDAPALIPGVDPAVPVPEVEVPKPEITVQ